VGKSENPGGYLPGFVLELEEGVKEVVKRSIAAELEEEVLRALKRKPHGRSKKVSQEAEGEAACQRCGNRRVGQFWRNGHYRRGLDTRWGHLDLEVPQVRCRCGGSVRIPSRILRKRQRIWDDLGWEMETEYGWGLSLRWIKAKEDAKLGGSLGLRTINERVHRAGDGREDWLQRRLDDFPPIVAVDGVWITIMKSTGEQAQDRLGRMRQKKVGQRYVILFAQGCWPTTGKHSLLTWLVAENESEESWGDLLFAVKQIQLRTPGRWELLIGDGAGGLAAAHQIYCANIPLQRCIFHKLRNFSRDLVIPDGMDRPNARTYRQSILNEACLIWQANGEVQAWQRYHAFCIKWLPQQPKAVHTLGRDFELTLAFFPVRQLALERGEVWPLSHLRTTSHLERENRNFRRRLRQAVLFHSQEGLQSAIFQNHILRSTLISTS